MFSGPDMHISQSSSMYRQVARLFLVHREIPR
jgi:hypothetical protein